MKRPSFSAILAAASAAHSPKAPSRNEIFHAREASAWDATKTALDTTNTALQAVPKTDPRVVNGIYLQDDLVLSLTILAPRANVPISTSDDSIAAKLGGMEYDAQVVGESLGGEPAPRQHIDPNLDKKE